MESTLNKDHLQAASHEAPHEAPIVKKMENELFNIADKAWRGEIGHSETNSLMLATTSLEKVKNGVYFKMSFGNVTVIDTTEGLVLVDCGVPPIASFLFQELKEKFPGKQLHSIIFTHGHVDHLGGARELQSKQPEKRIRLIGYKINFF